MSDIFNNLETYGYVALFLYSLGGGFFGIVVAVVLSTLGKMSLVVSIVVAILGNFLGDVLLFYIARNNKEFLKTMAKKHRKKLALSNLFIRKYGKIAIFIQKFLYGVKTLVPLMFGASKYDFFKFCVYNFFASVIFILVVATATYFASDILLKLVRFLKENVYIIPIIILLFLGMVVIVYKVIMQRRKN